MPRTEILTPVEYKKTATGGDFRRTTGVFFDKARMVSAEEEASRIVHVGHRFIVGKHQLEVFVNGQFKRAVEEIEGVFHGDYNEISAYTIQFQEDVIYQGDTIRFRITWGTYNPMVRPPSDLEANLKQVARDVFGDNYIFYGDGLRSDRAIGVIDSSTETPEINKYRTYSITEEVIIRNFLMGKPDDIRYIIWKVKATIDCNCALRLQGDLPFDGEPGDTMALIFDGLSWRELTRSINSMLYVGFEVPDGYTTLTFPVNWCTIEFGVWDSSYLRYVSVLDGTTMTIRLKANPGLYAQNLTAYYANADYPVNMIVHYVCGFETVKTDIQLNEIVGLEPSREIEWVEFSSLVAAEPFHLTGLALEVV